QLTEELLPRSGGAGDGATAVVDAAGPMQKVHGSGSSSGASGGSGVGRVFASLGLGWSLLSALEAAGDAELSAALAGGAEGPVRALLYQVLELVAEVLRGCRLAAGSSDTMYDDSDETSTAAPRDHSRHAAAVATALCSHYGVARVECLGHGPVGHLLRLAAETQATPPLGWHTAVALAPPQPSCASADPAAVNASCLGTSAALGDGARVAPAAVTAAMVGALGGVDRTAALAALRAAPELSDLRLATQWDAVFRSEL
ncbi:hypothetical protein Agub_g5711, partial [Astrephomene gubernaculifera]